MNVCAAVYIDCIPTYWLWLLNQVSITALHFGLFRLMPVEELVFSVTV